MLQHIVKVIRVHWRPSFESMVFFRTIFHAQLLLYSLDFDVSVASEVFSRSTGCV